MKKILAFILLIGIIALQQYALKNARAENKRLNNTVFGLLEGVERYKIRDSLNAAGTAILELKISEYRQVREEDARLIESLKIRLKRVENVSLHATEMQHRIVMPVHDTVFVVREMPPDTARRFSYRSPYVELDGVLRRDSVEIGLTSRDTLVQVVHRVPKRFLFFRYGTRALRQEIVSKNPHTEITYSEYIRLRK